MCYRGKTHKNVVAQYLNKLADDALNNSERLLYELICMITKRNGVRNIFIVKPSLLYTYILIYIFV